MCLIEMALVKVGKIFNTQGKCNTEIPETTRDEDRDNREDKRMEKDEFIRRHSASLRDC